MKSRDQTRPRNRIRNKLKALLSFEGSIWMKFLNYILYPGVSNYCLQMIHQNPDPFFGPKHLKSQSETKYVAWVDLMGTSVMTQHSTMVASTNIGKFHAHVKRSDEIPADSVYPHMDGVYAVTPHYENLMSFLKEIFRNAAKSLVNRYRDDELEPRFTYIMRGFVAYGEIFEGKNIDPKNETVLGGTDYASNMVMGNPITDAGGGEDSAPPFGVNLSSSLPKVDETTTWDWWSNDDEEATAHSLRFVLKKYWRWCEDELDYNAKEYPEDGPSHWEQAMRYLPDSKFEIGPIDSDQ